MDKEAPLYQTPDYWFHNSLGNVVFWQFTKLLKTSVECLPRKSLFILRFCYTYFLNVFLTFRRLTSTIVDVPHR